MLTRQVSAADAARAALEAREGGVALAVVLMIEGPAPGRRLLVRETGETRGTLGEPALDARALSLARRALAGGEAGTETIEEGGRRVVLFVEAHHPPDDLLVVGAGHIAVPLAQLGVLLGFRVTVLDDREEFATAERFPAAAAVRRTDFADPFRDVPIGPRTHVVLVTRAHRYDFDCLRRLLEREAPARYIGMIGSRRRVRAAFQALLEAGVPRESVARVRAPLGLEIGAETPEEIAVSIAAELVQLRRASPAQRAAGRAAEPIWARERVLERLLPEPETRHG